MGAETNVAMTEERIGDLAGSAVTDGVVNSRLAPFSVEQVLCTHRVIHLEAITATEEVGDSGEGLNREGCI